MGRRLNGRRAVGAIVGVSALVFGALLVHASQSNGARGPALVRGNVPGEWRYWGADAWSTRYSPLNQIDASNFNSLQIAWQWSAGAFAGSTE